ncbi:MAG: EVE domain-containing protein [Gammaproteobacteria bacterium]|nr:EVE domain-containing protein [Gammaproteobacteria bacterium]
MAHWLYPANTKYYDVLGAFSKKSAYWPIKSKVAKGDQVLIYLAAPYKQIGFICKVTEVDLDESTVLKHVSPFFKQVPDKNANLRYFMKLNSIKRIPLDEASPLSLTQLKVVGLKGMLMGPRKLDNTPGLLDYLKGHM